MTKEPKPCPRCDGEGGWHPNPGRGSRVRYDERNGEVYRSNWEECPDCRGEGTIEEDEEEDE